ncbi:MAG: hypothetical protein WB507_01010 [Solirubrobacterales bacterium]
MAASISRIGGARAIACAAIAVGLLLLLVLPVSQSFASEHTEVTGEYGKEGPKSSGLGVGCHLGYNGSTGHLYLAADGKIYGLAVSSGSATPLGGKFPVTTGISTGCGEPDIEVESSGAGNIYGVQSGGNGEIYGWDSSGNALGTPWPVSVPGGGELCGVDVGPGGGPWAGDYSQQKIFKYSAAGTATGTINVGFSLCKLAVDHVTGDVYASSYGGGQLVEFTASSGYTEKITFPAPGGEPGLAVNDAEHKLYVGNGSSTVKVYNTETTSLIETITLPEEGGHGLAVDEGTDTLFVAIGSGSSGYIVEYLGLTTPKATTGEPTGNSEVSGTANPNGVGPITECYFEYGLTTAYGSKQNCAESTPISSEETVHANLPGLIGEETYHYRLVLTNGEPHVIGRGADKTITPHNVKGLFTEAASEVTQDSAILNARFEGTNEDTHYYFEYGQTTNYGHKTAIPPGEDVGATTGATHISSTIAGLEPGITYHFRVVAENSIGLSKANDNSFRTNQLPAIISDTTSHITETSAEVDATINPHEFETDYFVEYGPTPQYGSIAPIPHGILAPGNSAESVPIQLTGLQGIRYHFRVVAANRWGRVETEDQSFNFYPPSCPNSIVRQQNESEYLPDCRSYELVSPEETGAVELTNSEFTADPYATNPPRFAFVGFLGGINGTEPTNSGDDTYVATRTSIGWKTHLVGVRGFEGQASGPLFASPDFSKFLNFDEPPFFEGQPQPPHNIPYTWDSEGNPLGRLPANFESVPKAEENLGAYQPSPDLNHLAFSSSNIAFTSEGLTTPPGSAYDYNVATETTTLISKKANGENIEQEPGNTSATKEEILFPGDNPEYGGYGYGSMAPPYHPGVSTDGSHILMSTASAPYNHFNEPPKPTRLYMRVNDLVTYEVSQGHDVNYVGMTADGTKVFFTSPERLTSEDTDNSVDLYMWSEAGNKLTLVSKGGEGAEGSGNSDECNATWVSGCGIRPLETQHYTDNSIAGESGEIYFYSPEQLDKTKGVPNQQNLYVYRDGSPQFVATLSPIGGEEGPVTRVQVSPDGSHAAFVTSSQVTSYNNAGMAEMYSYDPSQGLVVCVSCRPDGLPPTVNVEASKMGLFMSNDGRTFFSTEDPLVPTDTNEAQDVYEYVEGRPQLITPGTGTSQSHLGGYGGSGNKGSEGLAGVSADGVNVYFSTRDILVPQNKNGPFLAFYDARTDGGFLYEPPLAPCEAADECHGAGNSTPVEPTVSSEGSLGSRGNAPNPKRQRVKRSHHRRHHRKSQRRHGRRHHRSKFQRQQGSYRHA